jgi:hypothetical protein
MTTVFFELYLRKHHVFLASSSSENQKSYPIFLTAAFLQKGWTITPEKCHFLLDVDFLVR